MYRQTKPVWGPVRAYWLPAAYDRAECSNWIQYQRWRDTLEKRVNLRKVVQGGKAIERP